MQWEYACLVRKASVVDTSKPGKNAYTWEWTHTFYGPTGEVALQGDSSVEILNWLGCDGWEALAVEPRYAYFRETYGKYGHVVAGTVLGERQSEVNADAEWLVERTIWLKRPVNTGTSR